jgi:beta-glucosidase
MNTRILTMVAVALAASANAATPLPSDDPDVRAAAVLKQMTPEERTVLLHGAMAMSFGDIKAPVGSIPGAGFVAGISRLGVPSLTESDASLGVAYALGARGDGSTALPSGMALASTWNPELLREGGAMIGGEAHAKGFNVLLAGGVNLIREPRGGRTFEYLAHPSRASSRRTSSQPPSISP